MQLVENDRKHSQDDDKQLLHFRKGEGKREQEMGENTQTVDSNAWTDRLVLASV